MVAEQIVGRDYAYGDEFDYGLALILDGLEARFARLSRSEEERHDEQHDGDRDQRRSAASRARRRTASGSASCSGRAGPDAGPRARACRRGRGAGSPRSRRSASPPSGRAPRPSARPPGRWRDWSALRHVRPTTVETKRRSAARTASTWRTAISSTAASRMWTVSARLRITRCSRVAHSAGRSIAAQARTPTSRPAADHPRREAVVEVGQPGHHHGAGQRPRSASRSPGRWWGGTAPPRRDPGRDRGGRGVPCRPRPIWAGFDPLGIVGLISANSMLGR